MSRQPDFAGGSFSFLDLRFEAARRLGCEVVRLDPATGYLNELRRGPTRRLLLGGLSPLNDAVAARIVGDKAHTLRALESRGFRVPRTVRCLKPGHFGSGDYAELEGLDPARRLAEAVGYPLVVKPNFGSRGIGISTVENEDQLQSAIESIWQRDYLALAQSPAAGFDLRIDFLDGEFLFGYTRQPVRLLGDGRRSVRELLADLDVRFTGDGFERHLAKDPIWQQTVAGRSGLGLDSIPAEGERLDFETPILNLNRLCVAERLETLDPAWHEAGLEIGRCFSLRHFGIDLKIQSLDQDPSEAVVIEVNSSPSLLHMARTGHFEAALEAETRLLAKVLDDADRLDAHSRSRK